MLRLVQPNVTYLSQLQLLIAAFAQHDGIKGGISGSAYLCDYADLKQWITFVNNGVGRTGEVDFKQYLVVDENDQLIGLLNLRLSLNNYLFNYGGHIGYCVTPKMRQQGCGTQILALALQACKQLNINPVLLTCREDNIASAKVIMNNGGVLEDIRDYHGVKFKRFWINTKK